MLTKIGKLNWIGGVLDKDEQSIIFAAKHLSHSFLLVLVDDPYERIKALSLLNYCNISNLLVQETSEGNIKRVLHWNFGKDTLWFHTLTLKLRNQPRESLLDSLTMRHASYLNSPLIETFILWAFYFKVVSPWDGLIQDGRTINWQTNLNHNFNINVINRTIHKQNHWRDNGIKRES